jgi:signal transduction histidine kinase
VSPSRQRATITRRLTTILMATSATAVLIACVAFSTFSFVTNRLATVRDLTSLARITGHNCEAALAFVDPEDAAQMLAALGETPSLVQARMCDAQGGMFAEYRRSAEDKGALPPAGLVEGYVFGGKFLWLAHRIEKEGEFLGTLWLQDDLSQVRTALYRDLGVFIAVMVASLLAAYGIAARLRTRITRPILHLADIARVVSGQHDYSVRGVAETEDELGLLTHSFNEMLDGIQERETALRRANLDLGRAHDELEKKVEERTADLAASNRDLQQFAYVASHDLQEPLRMVASYVQLLERRYSGRLDEEADKFIRYAVDGAVRMQRLINDLLAYSRITTQERKSGPVDCECILQETLLNLQPAIQESRAIVSHDPLPTVQADGVQLTQLFQNLIGNAIKYRGADDPRVHLSVRRNGAEWRFCVRDNGVGIDPQFAERIFVIFQRLHSEKTHPGTGIGLAVCKRIVERHGGRIWVESEPGQGARFYFTLPQRRGDIP